MLRGPADLSFASTAFGQNRPRDTPCSCLPPHSNLFSSHSLWNQPLRYPRSQGTANTIFWSLTPHNRSTTSSRIPQNYSTEVEANTWPTCICKPPTPTSLWASISTMLLWRAWAAFPGIGRGEARGRRAFWKCKTSAAAALYSRKCWSLPKMSGVKPKVLWEPPSSWRRIWTQPLCTCMPWVLPLTPHLLKERKKKK